MARYREEAEKAAKAGETRVGIETIDKACPICKSDVKGDDTYLFYCKKCNILFRREELFLENPERLRGIVEHKILERYDRDKEKLKIEEEPIKLKAIKHHREKHAHKTAIHKTRPQKEHHAIHNEKRVYVASKSSNKLHISNCPFAKNIKKSNKEQFHSLADANKKKKYKHCRCIE